MLLASSKQAFVGLVSSAGKRRFSLSKLYASQATSFAVNGDRLWNDIHHTAKWSAPSPGGATRLCADENDKMVRDWFRDQVLALGAEYKVLCALEVLRSFKEQNINTRAPLVAINWTNEEGSRFFPPLGSSTVYAGQSSIEAAHASTSNDGSPLTMGSELTRIGYVGDGPNTFEEFPISAHFEVHVEQSTDLEKAGKPIGWVQGWEGMSWYEVVFHGQNGHANTYPMQGRRDTLQGAAKFMTSLETLAYHMGGRSTVTSIQSGPIGSCNIQSKTKVVFCVMHKNGDSLLEMGERAQQSAQAVAALHNLQHDWKRTLHLLPGDFTPEAVDCVARACGDKGIGSRTLTGHDSLSTLLKAPTAMVFVRSKDGISHAPEEWSDKEDCADGASALGKSVLNFDEYLEHQSK